MNLKKPKRRFSAQINNCVIIPDNPTDYGNHILTLEGERVWITAEKIRKQRSNNENRYYWGVVIHLIAEETGNDPETIHDCLKIMHLPKDIELGQTIRVGGSTADMTTTEFEDYLTRIRAWASMELGVYIPLPNEVNFEY